MINRMQLAISGSRGLKVGKVGSLALFGLVRYRYAMVVGGIDGKERDFRTIIYVRV